MTTTIENVSHPTSNWEREREFRNKLEAGKVMSIGAERGLTPRIAIDVIDPLLQIMDEAAKAADSKLGVC